MNRPPYRYTVYGIVVWSDTPLSLPEWPGGGLCEVEYRKAPATAFATAAAETTVEDGPDPWHRYACLRDGATYVRWETIGEFLVAANGRSILWRSVERASHESFQTYMLGQALSFALVKQRLEPLHAAVVVVGDQAIAFLGHSGYGKSSLAACFLHSRHRLLTDDLLLFRHAHGQVLAYPGPGRIKLFARTAGRFLNDAADSVPMNGETSKRVVLLDDSCRAAEPAALAAMYVLDSPRLACRAEQVISAPLSPRAAFVELLKATFNRRILSAERLARQFEQMTRLASCVPVRRLAYPRTMDRLEEVREVVLADLACVHV